MNTKVQDKWITTFFVYMYIIFKKFQSTLEVKRRWYQITKLIFYCFSPPYNLIIRIRNAIYFYKLSVILIRAKYGIILAEESERNKGNNPTPDKN